MILRVLKTKYKGYRTDIRLIQGSVTDKQLVKDTLMKHTKGVETVDLITCNFALNYFFINESTISTFFESVSERLNNGGLFIGTATDGDMIKVLFEWMGTDEINSKLFYVKKDSEESEPLHKYKFKLDTPFFKDADPITEYIIYKK